MKRQKLIVLSVDALVYEDLEFLKDQPNFKWLLENGSMVERVRSIYPTLTYPCHTTMATGCYPDKHGIIHNVEFTLDGKNHWMFQHHFVNPDCEDIMDACKKAGLTTASVGWPVHGNHPSVDYLVDECWPASGSPIEAYAQCYLDHGTPKWLFDEVVAPVLELRVGRKQPESSYFLTRISAEIIRRYQPDILIQHPGNVDVFRHKTGVFSTMVTEGLHQADEMLGMLIEATKDAGVFEDTNFIVTADHGHLNCVRSLNLNRLFLDRGWITLNEKGEVADYKVWCRGVGLCAYLYIKDPSLKEEVQALLEKMLSEGAWGFSKIFAQDEAKEMHLVGDFTFVLETDGCTRFSSDWNVPLVTNFEESLSGLRVKGEHGYHPDKGPRPPFLACGPAIKKGIVLKGAELVDGAPTYARILGTALPGADGRVLEELLK